MMVFKAQENSGDLPDMLGSISSYAEPTIWTKDIRITTYTAPRGSLFTRTGIGLDSASSLVEVMNSRQTPIEPKIRVYRALM